MMNSANSFLGNMSWDYSLYFPQSGSDPTRLRKFNALLLLLPGDYHSGQTLHSAAHSAAVRDFNRKVYAESPASDATYPAFREPARGRKMRSVHNGLVSDTTRQSAEHFYADSTSVMLLPLNATTTGESLKQAFNYAPERAPMDIVTPTSLDLVNKLAVLLQ